MTWRRGQEWEAEDQAGGGRQEVGSDCRGPMRDGGIRGVAVGNERGRRSMNLPGR